LSTTKLQINKGGGVPMFVVDNSTPAITISSNMTQIGSYTTTVPNLTYSGTLTTPLTASSIVQTNGSSQLIASNTLPSGCSATNMTLTNPTVSGNLTITPTSDNTGVFNVTNATNTLTLLNVDSTNSRVNVNSSLYLSGANNTRKFFVTDSLGPVLFNIDTSTPAVEIGSGTNCDLVCFSNIIQFGSGYIQTTLSTNSLVQTDGSRNLIASNTLPSNLTLQGTTVIPSGSVIQFQESGQNPINISNGTDIAGAGMLTISNPSLSSSNNLNIIPGYRGSVQNNGWVTYDLPGIGTHYFWDNVEISSNLQVDGSLNSTGMFQVNTTAFYVNPSIGNGAVGTYYNTLDDGTGKTTLNGPVKINNSTTFNGTINDNASNASQTNYTGYTGVAMPTVTRLYYQNTIVNPGANSNILTITLPSGIDYTKIVKLEAYMNTGTVGAHTNLLIPMNFAQNSAIVFSPLVSGSYIYFYTTSSWQMTTNTVIVNTFIEHI
jgi:hypothetical protein